MKKGYSYFVYFICTSKALKIQQTHFFSSIECIFNEKYQLVVFE